MTWYRRRKPMRTILIDGTGNTVEQTKKARLTAHQRSECAGGCGKVKTHGSRQEAAYCNQLGLEVKAGKIKSYRSHVRFYLTDPRRTYTGKHWTPDFLVTLNDGKEVIHEFKGYATEEYRLRRMLFHWCHPDIPTIEKTAKDLYL